VLPLYLTVEDVLAVTLNVPASDALSGTMKQVLACAHISDCQQLVLHIVINGCLKSSSNQVLTQVVGSGVGHLAEEIVVASQSVLQHNHLGVVTIASSSSAISVETFCA
jgi:hypothetical protein